MNHERDAGSSPDTARTVIEMESTWPGRRPVFHGSRGCDVQERFSVSVLTLTVTEDGELNRWPSLIGAFPSEELSAVRGGRRRPRRRDVA